MRIILDSADLAALLGGDLDLEGSATLTLSPNGDVRPWVLSALRARIQVPAPAPAPAAEWRIVRMHTEGKKGWTRSALVGRGEWVEICEDDGTDGGVPTPYADYLWYSLMGEVIEETIAEVDAETVRLACKDDRDAIRRIVRLAFPE